MTSTLFRLPDWLGGHEVEVKYVNTSDGFAKTRAVIEGNEVWIDIDYMQLVKDEAALYPPPDVPAVMVGDHVFVTEQLPAGKVFECPSPCHPLPLSWGALLDEAQKLDLPVVPLVPDPVQGAPELPWKRLVGNDGACFGVQPSFVEGHVYIQAEPVMGVVPELAEEFAYAILRAVRETRSGASS